ncbi:MAG: nitroreductase/quinone reductase family protein [Gammaproteobacteria bacterium]|nr:nitroreductase/quinone reductase family protein [Gammaproteobacteria bacterium]
MRIPEILFRILNPMMRMTLHSPAHFTFSDSVLLIKYKGRKTGKSFEIPVRYVEKDGVIKCYTDKRAGWWPNLKDNSDVVLRLRGRDVRCSTKVLTGDAENLKNELQEYLSKFPGDAVYHDVRLDSKGNPVESDIDIRSAVAVVVYATPVEI